jgi:hypothetical protein
MKRRIGRNKRGGWREKDGENGEQNIGDEMERDRERCNAT